MTACNLCHNKGYIYHGDQEEYDIEVCECQKEAKE